jgi:hypothetical protein
MAVDYCSPEGLEEKREERGLLCLDGGGMRKLTKAWCNRRYDHCGFKKKTRNKSEKERPSQERHKGRGGRGQRYWCHFSFWPGRKTAQPKGKRMGR